MLLLSELAYALPITLFIWGLSYLLTISRKKVQARTSRIIIHFSALLILNTLMNVMTTHAKNGTRTEGGVFLISIILSLLSCSILRYFEQKHNKNISKIDTKGLPIKYNDLNNSDPTEFNETDAYLLIANEIQSQNMDKGIWLKAMVEAGGSDHNQQILIYTSLRLKQLQAKFLAGDSVSNRTSSRTAHVSTVVDTNTDPHSTPVKDINAKVGRVVFIGAGTVCVGLLYFSYGYINTHLDSKTSTSFETKTNKLNTTTESLSKTAGNTLTSVNNQEVESTLGGMSQKPINPIFGETTSNSQKLLNLKDFNYQSRHLVDGYHAGKKIHMLGGKNLNKPYVGFIFNIDTKIEDELILNGEYKVAIDIYKYLETTGDTTASHNLGLMYIRGMGVKKDVKTGLIYLEKSMESLANFSTSNAYYEKGKRELNLNIQ